MVENEDENENESTAKRETKRITSDGIETGTTTETETETESDTGEAPQKNSTKANENSIPSDGTLSHSKSVTLAREKSYGINCRAECCMEKPFGLLGDWDRRRSVSMPKSIPTPSERTVFVQHSDSNVIGTSVYGLITPIVAGMLREKRQDIYCGSSVLTKYQPTTNPVLAQY